MADKHLQQLEVVAGAVSVAEIQTAASLTDYEFSHCCVADVLAGSGSSPDLRSRSLQRGFGSFSDGCHGYKRFNAEMNVTKI